jgi:hypothetical protein
MLFFEARQFIHAAVLSRKNLKEIEEILLNVPVAYGFRLIGSPNRNMCNILFSYFSLNLSCYTKDLAKLNSNWSEEYKKENSREVKSIYPISYNFEIAPNNDSNCNTVSKHCLLSKSNNDEIEENQKEFYSLDYYTHFNQ